MIALLLYVIATNGKAIKVGGQYGWTIGGDLAPIQANVGDTLLFDYFYIHDVQEMKGDDCDFDSATLLADPQSSPFTLQLTEPGVRWFSCSTSDHCRRGQKVQVIVSGEVAGQEEASSSCVNDPAGVLASADSDCNQVSTWLMSLGYEDLCEAEMQGMAYADLCPCECVGADAADADDNDDDSSDVKQENDLDELRTAMCIPDRCDMTALGFLSADPSGAMMVLMEMCVDRTAAKCQKVMQALYGCQDSSLPGSPDRAYLRFALKGITDQTEQMLGLRSADEQRERGFLGGDFETVSRSDDDGLTKEERLELGISADPGAKKADAKPEFEQERKGGWGGNGELAAAVCSEPASVDVEGNTGVFEVTCRSVPIPMVPGQVVDTVSSILNPFPSERPVAVLYMSARIVDENGREVSLRELYVHHIVGTLKFGAGAEDMRTPMEPFPEPYVLINNPRERGAADYVNLHLINTEGVSDEDLLSCIECACPEGFATENGDDGGVVCCTDCDSVLAPKEKNYYLEYGVRYRDVNDEDIPVNDFVWNAAHNGEYDVPLLASGEVHTMEKIARFGYPAEIEREEYEILRCEGHQHIGGIDIMVEDFESGEAICSMNSIYGSGGKHDIGNEQGYLIDMTATRFWPAKRIRGDRKIRIKSNYNATVRHTGVMGLVQVFVAGDRSEIVWQNEGFEVLPCEVPKLQGAAPGAVRALHSFKDETTTSLFWLGPEAKCVEGLTFKVERFDAASDTWVEVARDLADHTHRLDSNSEGKFAVVAIAAGGRESERVSIVVAAEGKGKMFKQMNGKGKNGKGKGKNGKGKGRNGMNGKGAVQL